MLNNNFESVDLPFLLRTRKIISERCSKVIYSLMSDGAFIAGGASRAFGYNLAVDKKLIKLSENERRKHELIDWNEIRITLFNNDVQENCDMSRPLRKCGRSDIDVFFPTEKLANNAVESLRQKYPGFYVSTTPAGFGHDFA